MPPAPTTKKLAVLGFPVRHSLSPAMHNAAFKHLGLDWHYEAIEVRPEKLASTLEKLRAAGYIGLNFTTPHKLAALDLVDDLDDSARQLGAVNTVVNIGKRLTGHNTDGYGLVQALREELSFELRDKSVVLLGAGGAGQAAAIQCALSGVCSLYLVNRTSDKAEMLSEKVRTRFPSVEVHIGLPLNWRADLLINATTLGLHPDDPQPICCDQVADVPFVFDMIYSPVETKLLKGMRQRGARTANGLSMLLHQGVRSLDLWLQAHSPGRDLRAPIEVMRTALLGNCRGGL